MAGPKATRRGVTTFEGAVVDRMMQEKRGTKYLLVIEVDRATFERSMPNATATAQAPWRRNVRA